ncbi:MAG TPA: ABC transporter ATP-binding protein [Ruminiclostridium sp.]|nr:ABC transporter ATP-binding protein [Clostridiaceae bacterium]HAA25945.1 ABC transporter ATP-binding protein [Ruminiclostridium sp.]
MNVRSILTEFIRKRLLSYIAGVVILIITSVVSLRIPKVLGNITDMLNTGRVTEKEVYGQVIFMFLLSVIAFCLRFVWRYFLIGNSRHVESHLRRKLFSHLQTLPVSFYNERRTGDLIAYAINDVNAVRRVFAFGFVAAIEGILINSVSVYYMADTIHPVLTLMALGPVPVVITLTILLRKTIRRRFEMVQKAFAAISERVQENIMGIRVIKAFAQEKPEMERFRGLSRKNMKTHMRLYSVSGMLGPVTQVCFGVSFLLFIIYGSEMVMTGTISLGDYIAFNSYMAAIMRPVINISRIIEVWQRGAASVKRLDEIFTEKSDIPDGVENLDRTENCDIEIKDLTFTYPQADEPALKNISLFIPSGSTLGIIGKTGSGKTTLANLLLKLYPVDYGRIFINGIDINNLSVDVLREKIGFVPQENFLFSTTISDNIRFYQEGITNEEIEEAARMSGIYDNILEFPEGFDTVVGERGVTLSGGQRQRVSIARALIKNPSVLILDDSLSAVDTETESEILNNLKGLLEHRTGIIISHRVSSVMYCDNIIYMDDGVIREQGNHKELMELDGEYCKLYLSQTEANTNSASEVCGNGRHE